MEKNSKILVLGGSGLVGSAIVRQLLKQGYTNIFTPTHNELDLCNKNKVDVYFIINKPEYIFMCAGYVGGIMANSNDKSGFFYNNITMGLNVVNAAAQYTVKKLVYFGSSCIYPGNKTDIITENDLLTGKLEQTNEGYALAKISIIKYCQYLYDAGHNFVSIMPTNLYGLNDNYNELNSHVLPSLIMKFHKAKVDSEPAVTLWGDGTPLREFMYSDDLAELALLVMEKYNSREIINASTADELTIAELANLVKDTIGYNGDIIWDKNKPNGTYRKHISIDKSLALGWQQHTALQDGINKVYRDYLTTYGKN